MAEKNLNLPSEQITPGLPGANKAPATRPAPAAGPKSQAKEKEGPAEHKNLRREVIETIVFVVVLVLMLKTFVAEAFVIPTGSMAETLYGHQKIIKCPKCSLRFPVNASKEVEPDDETKKTYKMVACICPNCAYKIDFERDRVNREPNSGDRVLVAKFLYDLVKEDPGRYDVVVFKYPERPQIDQVPRNYIKRLIGLPGETICIYNGNLYVIRDLAYAGRPVPDDARDLWQPDYMYVNDREAVQALRQGKAAILRKPPDVMLAQSRLVNDNDHQPDDLIDLRRSHWDGASDAGPWKPDSSSAPRVFTYGGGLENSLSWLRYRHWLRDETQATFIRDFMGYNSGTFASYYYGGAKAPSSTDLNWVGDLMLDCTVRVDGGDGQFVMELSKGTDRFQARWSLSDGKCSLWRIRATSEEPLKDGTADTALKAGGTYRLRFANFDDRLTVWVDKDLPFGDGVPYEPSGQDQPTEKNDLEPASIGAQGGKVAVSKVRLFRDTYYTTHLRGVRGDWADHDFTGQTMYVHPGHFLCLGDNSPESADSRYWGTVPERLMLGRALMVYYPFYWDAFPFYSPVNRTGPIK